MSRMDRLRQYQDPTAGPQGASRDARNLAQWSKRAEQNSQIAPRASDGPMRLPSTNVSTRDTSMGPKVSRSVDAHMRGKSDENHVDEADYLPGVRRNA